VHHVGILYGQFMMHGQRNIKLSNIQSQLLGVWTFTVISFYKQNIMFLKLELLPNHWTQLRSYLPTTSLRIGTDPVSKTYILF